MLVLLASIQLWLLRPQGVPLVATGALTTVIGVDRLANRPPGDRPPDGCRHVIDSSRVDPVAEFMRLTGGSVDVAIEALGTQATFVSCLHVLRPGGTLSSLGVRIV